MSQSQKKIKSIVKAMLISLGVFFLLFIVFSSFHIFHSQALAAEIANPKPINDIAKWGFIAAAISVGMGSLGAGIAVAYVGSAAVGAVGEKPEVSGKVLVFVGLAEGTAIYGLIIAIMILMKI